MFPTHTAPRVAAAGLVEVVVRFATPRHGMIRIDQLRALGATRGWIRYQLQRGWLVEIHPGVYLVGATVPTLRGRWMAATDAYGSGTQLIGLAGAACWGMIGEWQAPPIIEVGVNRHVRPREGVRPRRLSWLTTDRAVTCDGIPVASRAAVFASLVASVPDDQLINMLDKAQFRERSVIRSLTRLVAENPTMPKRGKIIDLIARYELGDAGTESGFEFDVGGVLRSLHAPEFVENAVLILPDGGRLKVDFYWSDARLILEADHTQHDTERGLAIDLGRGARVERAELGVARLPSSIPHEKRAEALAPVVARARHQRDGPPIRVATYDRFVHRRAISPNGRSTATV